MVCGSPGLSGCRCLSIIRVAYTWNPTVSRGSTQTCTFTSWIFLPNKPTTPKNIGEGSKFPRRQLCKEALFVQYDKNKHVRILSDPIPIKSIFEVTKVLRSIIDTSIKGGDFYDAWKFFACHFSNGSFHNKCIGFYK